MTFGKCVWDGCTRHATKQATKACAAHHAVLRGARCESCGGPLRSETDVTRRRCAGCRGVRAA